MQQFKPSSLTIKIKSRLDNLLIARLSTKSIIDYFFEDEIKAYNIELAVVEAITNSIKHAYKFDENQEVEISVELEADRITFKVSDTGISMKKLTRKELNYSYENIPDGGFGLCIIQSVMNEVKYETIENKNTLTMVAIARGS